MSRWVTLTGFLEQCQRRAQVAKVRSRGENLNALQYGVLFID